jgi:CRISPR-associated protein Cmr4
MYKQKAALFMLCETSLHAGSGDDLGIVDLPIQRERHTSFPKVESSSLKGALRERFEKADDNASNKDFQFNIQRTFGYDDKSKSANAFKESVQTKDSDNTQYAGSLAFTDARLLLFPVKSMKGVFVWITCHQVLNKFASDMAIAGISIQGLDALKSLKVDEGKALSASNAPCINKAVVLEEYAFEVETKSEVTDLATTLSEIVFKDTQLAYWKGLLQKNLIVLSDTDFRDFTNMSTEVITRTKIDNETGTVQDGALFTEEYLPTDSVLYSLVFAADEYGKNRKTENAIWVMDFFAKAMQRFGFFQLGGNATLGKGIIRTQLKGGKNG